MNDTRRKLNMAGEQSLDINDKFLMVTRKVDLYYLTQQQYNEDARKSGVTIL